MQRSKEEKLADIMLGEAVLQLLRGDGAVSPTSLITTLGRMAEQEKDVARHQACIRAINDVRTSMSRTGPVAANSGNTVSRLFAGHGPKDGSKKH